MPAAVTAAAACSAASVPAQLPATPGVMPGVCKYFVNSGSCSAGSSCRFLHPDATAHLGMKSQWVAEKVTRRCMRPTIPADTADPHGKVRAGAGCLLRRTLQHSWWLQARKSASAAVLAQVRMNASSHAERARDLTHLCQWLLHTHSIEQLNQGGGVLDVAGGRGELSFQLHVRGVHVTCVDRRVCKPCKAMIRHAASHPDDAGPRMLMGEDFDLQLQKWADMCAAAACLCERVTHMIQGARVVAFTRPAPRRGNLPPNPLLPPALCRHPV